MTQKTHFTNLLEINLAMFLISTSGALGRYIDMPVPVIIGFRALFAALFLFLYCKWKKISIKVDSKDRGGIILSGILMGAHWVTYFYALKLSNVAIGMLSIFTYPVITAFLEPIVLKTKFQKMHIVLALLVLLGIYFLVPDFDIENTYFKAVLFGVFSALCYSLRNLITKTKVQRYHGSMLMWYQLVVVGICLTPVLFFMDSSGIQSQWLPVVVLALLTTAIGHTLYVLSFKKFSITTASILGSVQPVYGILIGMLFLKEYPSLTTIVGGVLILTAVVIESVRTYK